MLLCSTEAFTLQMLLASGRCMRHSKGLLPSHLRSYFECSVEGPRDRSFERLTVKVATSLRGQIVNSVLSNWSSAVNEGDDVDCCCSLACLSLSEACTG